MEEIIIFTPKQFRDIVNYNLSKGAAIAVASVIIGFAFNETSKWMYGRQIHKEANARKTHIRRSDYVPFGGNPDHDGQSQKLVRV